MLLAPGRVAQFWSSTPTAPVTSARSGTCFALAGPGPELNLVSARAVRSRLPRHRGVDHGRARPPRFGAMAFLVIAAFLLTNKVYSPQYVLWLLPFVVLARPRWRDWLIFTAGELDLLRGIWWHLGGLLAPGRQLGRPDLLAGGDHPARHPDLGGDAGDPGRPVPRARPRTRGRVDDPTGGVLDGAPTTAGGRVAGGRGPGPASALGRLHDERAPGSPTVGRIMARTWAQGEPLGSWSKSPFDSSTAERRLGSDGLTGGSSSRRGSPAGG